MEKNKPPFLKIHNDIQQIRKDMNKFFLQQISLRHSVNYFTKGKWIPPTDVYETAELFIVKVELSGISKEEIIVELEKNKLTISGARLEKNKDEMENYYQVEINYGPFERVILLPENIDESSIDAEYDNGFLNITIKKQSLVEKNKNVHLKVNEVKRK